MLASIALATFIATFVGGFFALRFRDQLHLILGFSAGAVVGVALFDLLPEAIELSHGAAVTGLYVALGFFAYLLIDRTIFLHSHDHDDEHAGHAHERGVLGASTLSAHSLLDGIAIGLSYQASPAIGLIVTAAVLTHDFSDGINTVNVILRSGGGWRQAFKWLLIDSLAPIMGILLTLFVSVPLAALGPILAVFAGCFLYLGAADLIPESHHRHPRLMTTFMTLLGALVIYLAVSLTSL